MKATFGYKLITRYFLNDERSLTDNQKQDIIYDEMLGKGQEGHQQAKIMVTISNGEEKEVILSPNSGIKMTTLDKETMFALTKNTSYITTLHFADINGNEMEVYIEVYDVDASGNELVRMALNGSIADIPINRFRQLLLMLPANFAEKQDQRELGFTAFTQALAGESSNVQPGTSTQDVIIEQVLFSKP